MSFQRVRALVPVRHDGVLRIPGVTTGENAQDFVVRVAQATRMIELGLVSFIEAADPPATGLEQVFVDSSGTLRRPGGGVVGGAGPYAALLASIPSRDKSSAFLDVSGRLAHMTPEAGNTGAFAVPGYMSSVAAVNGGISMAPGKLDWTPASESLMVAFEINQAAPAAALTVLGVGGRNIAGECGFYLSLRQTPAPAGRLKIVSFIESNLVSDVNDSASVFADGTPRRGVLLWDCVAGQFSLFADGVLDRQYTPAAQYPAGMRCRADGGGVRIGGLPGNTTAAVPAAFAGLQILKWAGSPPVGVLRAIAKHAEQPRVPLNAADF